MTTRGIPAAAPADRSRNDVRMDGVYFRRATASGDFLKALEPGGYSYCVMVRTGRLMLAIDFPTAIEVELAAGDAVAVSGLAPHAFRAGPSTGGATGRFDISALGAAPPPADIELVLGIAPNESLALGSLMLGPIVVRAGEHPGLSRRLWGAVTMIEDEYSDPNAMDHDIVVRRLAEIMLVNMSRRVFGDGRDQGAATQGPSSGRVLLAVNAVLRDPDVAWTLPDLARTAGMSRTRFVEAFKAVTGQSPGRIISRLRLTAIAHRLASEPLSVEAAADEAGYSSSAAFVRAFQRAFGETPARWRRQRRGPEPAQRRRPSIRAAIGARRSPVTD
ncbi:MAG TPA: AraC family transcriptional regulator [Caulobacteraceae bacterium]|nr:AraC family transcriptional regulator [Caulobacteraceae bacterium]